MSLALDLGTCILHSTKSNISVASKASVAFIRSPELTAVTDITNLEQLLDSGEFWVDQTSELPLNIRLVLKSDREPLPTVVMHIENAICNAKLWSDLGLATRFQSSEHILKSSNEAILSLFISLQKNDEEALREEAPRARRLQWPVVMCSLHEAQPPTTFPMARLSLVNLSMELQIWNGHQRKQRRSCYKLQSSLTSPYNSSFATGVNGTVQDNGWDGLTVAPLHSLPNLSQQTRPASGDDLLETGRELQELDNHCGNNAQCSHAIGASALEVENVQVTEDLFRLFDIGFRNILVPQPLRPNGVVKASTEASRSLAEIAPAVFKPGYRHAMNQRANLMPLVAKSIASVLDKTTNPNLQQRASALEESFWSRYGGLGRPSRIPDVKFMVKTFLWRNTQKGIHASKRSKRLSPLESTDAVKDEFPMLDDNNLDAVSRSEETDYTNVQHSYQLDGLLDIDNNEFEFEFEFCDNDDECLFSPPEIQDGSSDGMMDDNNSEGDEVELGEMMASAYHSDNIGETGTEHDLLSESSILEWDNQSATSDFQPVEVGWNSGPSCGDSEMLTSDPLEEILTSPVLCPADAVSPSDFSCTNVEDEMLCDHV